MNSKSITFIFILLSLYLTNAFPVELSKRSCSKSYKVSKGDTCYKIWTKYGLSESQFKSLNSGISCSNLKIGASVCVGSSSGHSSSCKKTYSIKSGDTCYSVWTKYNLSESQFKSLNSGVNCSKLKKGQEVCVSGGSSSGSNSGSNSGSGSSSGSCKSYHKVVSGDTCYGIQQKYGISETTLRNINSRISCSNLQIGDKVCVKGSSTSTTKKESSSSTSHEATSFTWSRECKNSKNFALTFDDGVYDYDNALLDLLKKKGVKATFFINGSNMSDITSSSVRKTIKRMYDEGHNVLSHTWSHADLTTLSSSGVRSELKKLEDEIYDIIGKRPKTVRPPYMAGFGNDNVVSLLKKYGYSDGVLWYVDTEDWSNKGNFDVIVNFIKEALKTSDRPIILNHSYYQNITKDKLLNLVEKEIDYLEGEGLKGVNMETCLGHSVYRSSGEGFPN